MEVIKRNISLVIGLAIPIVMILLVAGSIYLPGLFTKPHVNFLYASGNDSSDSYYYSNGQQYAVRSNTLIETPIRQHENTDQLPVPMDTKLYIYDVAKNEAREISFEEAKNLNLDSNIISPDGFEFVCGSRDYGFFPLFGGPHGDYRDRYLKGHNVSRKLNLQLNSSNTRRNNPYFLGWIE
ncbi:MAG: hypothetical protein WCS77_10540 [Elusimicrobiaceae bacterium]